MSATVRESGNVAIWLVFLQMDRASSNVRGLPTMATPGDRLYVNANDTAFQAAANTRSKILRTVPRGHKCLEIQRVGDEISARPGGHTPSAVAAYQAQPGSSSAHRWKEVGGLDMSCSRAACHSFSHLPASVSSLWGAERLRATKLGNQGRPVG